MGQMRLMGLTGIRGHGGGPGVKAPNREPRTANREPIAYQAQKATVNQTDAVSSLKNKFEETTSSREK